MREMKESNIPWVGPIPKEWNVGRIKQGYDVTLGKMYAAKEQQKEDGTLENYLCAANIKWAGIDTSVHKQMYFTEKEKEQYLLNNGDAVVMEGGMAGTTCLYKGEYYPCYIQNSVHKISSKNNNSTSFFAYWMEVVCSSGYVENVCNKATIMHYTKDKVCNTPLLLIPVEEQNEIVGYLNEKCSVINSSISRHQQIIEKLEEYRKSVITQAVTKGISSNSKVKTTNNKWLDEIPANWDLVRLKHMCRYISDGSHFSPQTHTDGKPYVTATNIRGIGIDYESCKKINNDDFQTLANNGCEIFKDDVLLVKDGATTGRVGYKNDDVSAVALSSVAIMRSAARVLPMYLMYYLQSEPMQQQILSSMAGSAMPRTVIAKIVNYYGVIPPLAEQQIIVSMLNDKTTEIQHSIEIHQQLIDKLKEYKQSLIYNAVTGKIDCRTEGGEVQ